MFFICWILTTKTRVAGCMFALMHVFATVAETSMNSTMSCWRSERLFLVYIDQRFQQLLQVYPPAANPVPRQ
jgi:hypothetical protein